MLKLYSWHYEGVPRLGTVIISPDAMESLSGAGVSESERDAVLAFGTDSKAPSGDAVAGYRDYGGVRLEFRTWRHLPGAAAVCVNGYRVREL